MDFGVIGYKCGRWVGIIIIFFCGGDFEVCKNVG